MSMKPIEANRISLSFFLVNKIRATCQFPHTGVRKGAVMALGQFCSGFHSLLQEAGAEDKTARMYRKNTCLAYCQKCKFHA